MNLFETFNIADIDFQNKSESNGKYGIVYCVTNKAGKKFALKEMPRDSWKEPVSSSEIFQFC